MNLNNEAKTTEVNFSFLRRRRKLLFHLNSSGKYHTFKEQLKVMKLCVWGGEDLCISLYKLTNLLTGASMFMAHRVLCVELTE